MQQRLKKTATMAPAQLLQTPDQTVPEHNKLRQKQDHQNLRHHKLKKFLSKSRAQPNLNRKNRNKNVVTNNKTNRNKKAVTSSKRNKNKRSATSKKRSRKKTAQCSRSHHNHLHHPCRRHQCRV
jgi:D-lyxose ketol-isomerase